MQKLTSLSLADCSRTQHVKRWHIVDMLKDQSVAEHSFMVALIAREILRRSGRVDVSVAELLEYALIHDVNEAITGDIPSPVKKAVDFSNLEKSIDPDPYEPCELVKLIVKLADLIEAYVHLNKYGFKSPTKTHTLKVLSKKAADVCLHLDSEYTIVGKWADVKATIFHDLDCSNLTIVEKACDV